MTLEMKLNVLCTLSQPERAAYAAQITTCLHPRPLPPQISRPPNISFKLQGKKEERENINYIRLQKQRYKRTHTSYINVREHLFRKYGVLWRTTMNEWLPTFKRQHHWANRTQKADFTPWRPMVATKLHTKKPKGVLQIVINLNLTSRKLLQVLMVWQ